MMVPEVARRAGSFGCWPDFLGQGRRSAACARHSVIYSVPDSFPNMPLLSSGMASIWLPETWAIN